MGGFSGTPGPGAYSPSGTSLLLYHYYWCLFCFWHLFPGESNSLHIVVYVESASAHACLLFRCLAVWGAGHLHVLHHVDVS